MSRNNNFMKLVRAREHTYGSISNIPTDVLKEIAEELPNDSGDIDMTKQEHYALTYMVKRGDFSFSVMAANLGRSQTWLKSRLPVIKKEIGR
ncbi:hypothetical protein [Furfurilactobacillus entadae]|uniref:hypothetical protein n=1 Tax=Furfurilactobacillus entadae TaxID=2922307 RepID=UPI0035E64E81